MNDRPTDSRAKIGLPRTKNGRADPKRTIELLKTLGSLGFTDEAFVLLHHFRLKNRKAGISAHLRHCARISSFEVDGANALLQRRLQLVLDAYRALGFRSGSTRLFCALADATFNELPPSN